MRRTLLITGSRSPLLAEAALGLYCTKQHCTKRRRCAIRSGATSSARPGFTLIELLVVITILTILFGLVFAVLGTAGDKAKINSTKTTLQFLSEALKQRQMAFNKDLTDQERTRKRDNSWRNILNNALLYVPVVSGIDPAASALDAAKSLVREDRYRSLFPQRVGDPSGSPTNSDLVGLDQTLGGTGALADSPMLAGLVEYAREATGNAALTPAAAQALFRSNAESESSELLYYMLTDGGDGVSNDLLNNVPPKHIGDTDGDDLLEFLDDWGHPLRFYNAPTSLLANPAVATALMPGLSTSGSGPYDGAGAITATLDASLLFSNNYHARNVNFTPLIVSAGPDEILGLYEPNDTSSPTSRLAGVQDTDTAMDNVTNIQRTGGQ